MKKITLAIAASLCATFAFGQGTCATATPVSLTSNTSVASYGSEVPTLLCGGANTSPTPATGGSWYTFTATANGVLNVNSDLPANGNVDTRVNIYSGNCANLVCVGGNDDIDYTGGIFSSAINVSVTAGTTYYVAWDNRWSADAFAFSTTFTAVNAAPNAVTMPTPLDGATGVAVDPADNNMDGTPDNGVALSWTPDPNGAPATEYDILYGDSPTTLQNLTAAATYTNTSVNITGNTYNDLNYWQIIAINSAGSTPGPIWSFTTETATGSPASNAITPTPADGATNVVIDVADQDLDGLPDNSVSVSWTIGTNGAAPNAATIRLGTDPTALNTLTTSFTGTNARFLQLDGGTQYYWQAVPTNNGSEAANQPIWSFTTDGTASIDDLNGAKLFSVYPSPADTFLNIVSEEIVSDITITNLLGQRVIENATLNNNSVDVSSLTSGIYIISTTIGNRVTSLRFVKK